ncbi:MAG: phospholipid transport system substrate-binding protein [Gammaproteobacteria bacterium]
MNLGNHGQRAPILISAMITLISCGNFVMVDRAHSAPNSAQEFILATTQKVLQAVSASPTPVVVGSAQAIEISETHIGPYLDMDKAARLVLGPQWRTATPEEQVRFVAAFRGIAIKIFAGTIPKFAGAQIEILPEDKRAESDMKVVKTQAVPSAGPPVRIDFRVHQVAGQWAVIDFSVEGLSVLNTYRADFKPILRREGMAGLIESLEKRVQR